MSRNLLLSLLFCFSFSSIQAQSPWIIEGDEYGFLGEHAQYWRDSTSNASLEEAKAQEYTQGTSTVLNFNRDDVAYWIKVPVVNTSDNDLFYLQIEFPSIDSIEVFLDGSSTPDFSTGARYNFDHRPVDHPTFLFPLVIASNDSAEIYLRVRTKDQLFLPIRIGNRQSISEDNGKKLVFLGLYFGVIFVMFFYNLFIYYTTRDNSYLWYILYIAAIGLTQASLEGMTFQILFPNSPGLYNASITYFSAFVGLTAIEFAKIFVQTKRFTPRMHKGLRIFQILYILSMLSYLFGK